MKPTIKITAVDAARNGLNIQKDFIAVEDLGRFGFDTKIINDMIKYEIFPQTYMHIGRVIVLRVEIFGIVNKLLLNSMELYRVVDNSDTIVNNLKEQVNRYMVTLTPADQEAIERGDVSYLELLVKRTEEAKAAAEAADLPPAEVVSAESQESAS